MDINHISVSRKNTYDQCQQKYKYQYHLKVERDDEEPFYFTYGKIIHKIAEHFVEHKAEIPLGDVTTDVLKGKIELEKGVTAPEKLPAEYQRRLNKDLRSIQKLMDSMGTDGIVEHEIYYDLDPPHGRFVKGFIDRLIIKGNKAWIIDYKTTKKGRWRKTRKTITQDLQLCVYARAVQREFEIEPENIKAGLYYVDGGSLVAATFTESTLIKVEQELLKTFKRIEQSDPDKVWGNVGHHCKRCDFRVKCPFYKPLSTQQSGWDGDFNNL